MRIIQDLTTDLTDLFTDLCLFVQIVEAGEFPACAGLLEVINDYLVSSRVGTRNTEALRVFRIHLDLSLAKTGRSVGLFVEDLSIAPGKLSLCSNGRNTIRHREWKLRHSRDCLNVVLADRGLKTLKESLRRLGAGEQQQ